MVTNGGLRQLILSVSGIINMNKFDLRQEVGTNEYPVEHANSTMIQYIY